MNTEEELSRLVGTVEGVMLSLTRITKDLYGNGQPGIMDRLTRLEDALENLAVTSKHNSEATFASISVAAEIVRKLAESVEILKDIISDHAADKEKHTLQGMIFKDPPKLLKTIGGIFAGGIVLFIILHTLIEDFPTVWGTILKFFGI